jgi:hypothetical protein
LEAITFRSRIRRIFGEGGYRKYLQIYVINNTMEYMRSLSGLTPIGSMQSKLQKDYNKRVSATLPIRNSLQSKSLMTGNCLKTNKITIQ